jgi:peptidoglycan/LPS O-acetylase OafA/YrhL
VPGPPAQWGATWHSVVELSFWGTADLFSFGMVLAVIAVEVADGELRLPARWMPATAVAAVVLYVVVSVGTANEQLSYRPSNTLVALAATLGLALVVLPTAAKRSATTLQRFLESRPLFVLGTVSYSIFLWQVPVIFWLRDHDVLLAGTGGLLVNVVFIFSVTFALSVATYVLVEAPALKLKRRRARRDSTAAVPASEPL